ncbi:MAG: hypothetical protein OXI73_15265, partial [Rhodospirillales bacterium]|nr:hypothetical protein [Rhodospirillales bacterium]
MTVAFKAVYGERCRKAGCADRHGAPGVDTFGQADHAVGFNPGKTGITAIPVFSQATPEHDDLVAGTAMPIGAFQHLSGEIDPA